MRITTTAVLAALLLGGCTTDMEKGLCPTAAVLATTSSLTVFRPGAPADPSGELYTVQMVNAKSGCDFDKDRFRTSSKVELHFRATRAPSPDAAQYQVPYFVAVTQGGSRILAKRVFNLNVAFEAGEASKAFTDTIDSAVIKMAKGHKIGEYEILVGLQLTQEQLDYDRKMGRFAQ